MNRLLTTAVQLALIASIAYTIYYANKEIKNK